MTSWLFKESIAYRPFHYPWANDLWKEHERMVWIEDEIPLTDDVTAWQNGTMSEDEKDFVTQILRMFTQSDVNVGQNYHHNIIPHIRNNEVVKMLGGFANREGTHQNAYALLVDTLGLPESEHTAFLEIAEMAEKNDFMLECDSSTIRGLAQTIAKSTFNEGVSLFASFAMLLNFQRFGKMLGMAKIVEWSLKDESKHVEGITKLFSTICKEHPRIVTEKFKREIYTMARRVVEIEDAFIDLAFANHNIQGLTKEEIKEYIRYITDRRLVQLGLKPNYGIEQNPISWLDWLTSATQHTNFFEGKVAEYEVAGLQGEIKYEDDKVFEIVSKDGCPFCLSAKELLTNLGYHFTERKINDDTTRNAFYDHYGWQGKERSVPKIFLNGELYAMGFNDLKKKLED